MRNFELTNIILNDEDCFAVTRCQGILAQCRLRFDVKYIQNYLERLALVSEYKWNVDSERAFEILREHSLV